MMLDPTTASVTGRTEIEDLIHKLNSQPTPDPGGWTLAAINDQPVNIVVPSGPLTSDHKRLGQFLREQDEFSLIGQFNNRPDINFCGFQRPLRSDLLAHKFGRIVVRQWMLVRVDSYESRDAFEQRQPPLFVFQFDPKAEGGMAGPKISTTAELGRLLSLLPTTQNDTGSLRTFAIKSPQGEFTCLHPQRLPEYHRQLFATKLADTEYITITANSDKNGSFNYLGLEHHLNQWREKPWRVAFEKGVVKTTEVLSGSGVPIIKYNHTRDASRRSRASVVCEDPIALLDELSASRGENTATTVIALDGRTYELSNEQAWSTAADALGTALQASGDRVSIQGKINQSGGFYALGFRWHHKQMYSACRECPVTIEFVGATPQRITIFDKRDPAKLLFTKDHVTGEYNSQLNLKEIIKNVETDEGYDARTQLATIEDQGNLLSVRLKSKGASGAFDELLARKMQGASNVTVQTTLSTGGHWSGYDLHYHGSETNRERACLLSFSNGKCLAVEFDTPALSTFQAATVVPMHNVGASRVSRGVFSEVLLLSVPEITFAKSTTSGGRFVVATQGEFPSSLLSDLDRFRLSLSSLSDAADWDQTALRYRELVPALPCYFTTALMVHWLQQMSSTGELPWPQIILSAMSGPGVTFDAFRKADPSFERSPPSVTDLDSSMQMLRLSSNPTQICGDVRSLPFASDSFDLIECSAPHRIADTEAATLALAELSRVVGLGGILVMRAESYGFNEKLNERAVEQGFKLMVPVNARLVLPEQYLDGLQELERAKVSAAMRITSFLILRKVRDGAVLDIDFPLLAIPKGLREELRDIRGILRKLQLEKVDLRLIQLVEQANILFSDIDGAVAVAEHRALFATVAQFALRVFTHAELGIHRNSRGENKLFVRPEDRTPQQTLARVAHQVGVIGQQTQNLARIESVESDVYRYAAATRRLYDLLATLLASQLNDQRESPLAINS